MEETPTGYVTEMGVATHNKGRLTFIVELYLFFWGYMGVQKGYIVVFSPANQCLILHLIYHGYFGHGSKIKYILCCSIG